MLNKEIKSFELVLCGHPDKVCDAVSKAIADENVGGRNAIECMWGNKLFVVSGETNKQWSDDDLAMAVGKVLRDVVGLNVDELESLQIINNLNTQSAEINGIVGVSGTGDNGIYFGGYHRVYSPVIQKMKDLCVALNLSRLASLGYRTDGKFIFVVDSKGNVVEIVLNVAKFGGVTPRYNDLESFIRDFIVNGGLSKHSELRILINPKGNWTNCFGFADCGLTGRKLACDGSCGLFPHGGGAMFGKDISKADITVPLYLSKLAEMHIGRFDRECIFSAASVIGDTMIDVFRNGKFFERVEFERMKGYLSKKNLDIFGVIR